MATVEGEEAKKFEIQYMYGGGGRNTGNQDDKMQTTAIRNNERKINSNTGKAGKNTPKAGRKGKGNPEDGRKFNPGWKL